MCVWVWVYVRCCQTILSPFSVGLLLLFASRSIMNYGIVFPVSKMSYANILQRTHNNIHCSLSLTIFAHVRVKWVRAKWYNICMSICVCVCVWICTINKCAQLSHCWLWILFMPKYWKASHECHGTKWHGKYLWQPQFDENLDDHLIILMKIWFCTPTHNAPSDTQTTLVFIKQTTVYVYMRVVRLFGIHLCRLQYLVIYIYCAPPFVSPNSIEDFGAILFICCCCFCCFSSLFLCILSVSRQLEAIWCVYIMWIPPRGTERKKNTYHTTLRHISTFFLSSFFFVYFALDRIHCRHNFVSAALFFIY